MQIIAEDIARRVAKISALHKSIAAVICMGSCARGEETYFVNTSGEAEMMSDFEMLIVVESLNEIKGISADLDQLRNELLDIRHSENFDLEWSFKTKNELKWLDKRFIFFEAAESAKVLYGEANILEAFPKINEKNLVYSELNTVILHRLYHVIRNMGSDDLKYKQYVIARNSLDFATAFLPLVGILTSSYTKRMNVFETVGSQYHIPKDLIRRHRDYLGMKIDYNSNLYDKYNYIEMLGDFYGDFKLLQHLQRELQNGVLFRSNGRKMLSALYRLNVTDIGICLNRRKRLEKLCDEMFKTIRYSNTGNAELAHIKGQMKELFGYC